MDFELSEDTRAIAETARAFLADRAPLASVRRVYDREMAFDRDLWSEMAGMGWQGAAIPETYGGSGLARETLCVLAEEIGRALAPVPFLGSVCMATEALLAHGREEDCARLLPDLAAGRTVGAVALAEGAGDLAARGIGTRVEGGRLTGRKHPVADAALADFLIVAARGEDGALGLYLTETGTAAVAIDPLEAIDPSRNMGLVTFDGAAAIPLDRDWHGRSSLAALLDRFAVFVAYEQLGGASACLDMACDYARERYAFGRPIGSFQAIKHKLADVYVATELARSNALFATWALDANASELSGAAAAARLSATSAFDLAARETMQTHGGIGITWEADCHLFTRRARTAALEIGGPLYWQDRLLDGLVPARVEEA